MDKKIKYTLCTLAALLLFGKAMTAGAMDAKTFFSLPLNEWPQLTSQQKQEGIKGISDAMGKGLDTAAIAKVEECMNLFSTMPMWASSDAGTLYTKCTMQMNVGKPAATEQRVDKLVACIQGQVPDFTKEEFYSVTFSAVGQALAKDVGQEPVINQTPRTQQIVQAIDACGGM